MSMNHRPTIV